MLSFLVIFLLSFFAALVWFEVKSYYIDQADLKLVMILLPLLSECHRAPSTCCHTSPSLLTFLVKLHENLII